MKYRVCCPNCGSEYVVEMDFAPGFCGRCGSDSPDVIEIKGKSRIKAEEWMAELDEIRPRLEEAWSAYFDVRVKYEDRLVNLAQYHKRKIVTEEEYDRYRINPQRFKIKLNDAVREYRMKRREK